MLEVASLETLLSSVCFMRLQNSEADNVVSMDIVFVDSFINVVLLYIDGVGVVSVDSNVAPLVVAVVVLGVVVLGISVVVVEVVVLGIFVVGISFVVVIEVVVLGISVVVVFGIVFFI